MAKEYVVHGARLECSMGEFSSNLKVSSKHRVKLNGKYKANIGDCKPLVNVQPFGTCRSLVHPDAATATALAADAGSDDELTPPPTPCTPACSVWIPTKTDCFLDGMPPLMSTDKAICPLGAGVISVMDSGQGKG